LDEQDYKYLKNFLIIIIKFPFIKQNRDEITKALIVNECNDSIINYFNDNLNSYIQNLNSELKQDKYNERPKMNNGKKYNMSNYSESYEPLRGERHSFKLRSISNFKTGNKNSRIKLSINSSGFYTPEFKHNRRDSIRNFRRFTLNNINNPRTSLLSKNENYSRINSISEGMSNLLLKCEEGKHRESSGDRKEMSTKSKLRIAVEGHFYTEDDDKNNIDINENINESNINNDTENNMDNDGEYEEEVNKIVSVDELPINPNESMMSLSKSNNIGCEPVNIIQESKEEEENDDAEQEKGNINKSYDVKNNNNIKILSDKEINDFFYQQFSDDKKPKKEQKNIKIDNKNKKNSKKNNSSKNSSEDNFLDKNSKKNENLVKKGNRNTSTGMEKKGKIKNNYKQNVFFMAKNRKKNLKDSLINKNDNLILELSTKGKELVNNIGNQINKDNKSVVSKGKMPTDSVTRKNLLSLYNQMKVKK
jgi:hypothetical protein